MATCKNCRFRGLQNFTALPKEYQCTLSGRWHPEFDECDCDIARIRANHKFEQDRKEEKGSARCDACKKVVAQVDTEESKIQSLESKNEELQKRIAELEDNIKALEETKNEVQEEATITVAESSSEETKPEAEEKEVVEEPTEQIADKPVVEEAKKQRWYTDGVNNKLAYECPEGYTLGRAKKVKPVEEEDTNV